MANIFIYGGLGIMLAGAIFGFFVALKGFKETKWSDVDKISMFASFYRGPATPVMKRLTRIWSVVMVVGLILTAIGISLAF